MSSTELDQRDPMQDLVAQVSGEGFGKQIAAALPGNVTPKRFVRVTITALRENPDLVGADRASLFSAVVRCAQDGLLPDSREAALVMFGRKATYMPMIGGYRKIAAECGWSLRTRVVYENDTFEHTLGLDETLVHHPTRPGLERGPMVAAYAVATHKDGRREIEVVYAEDVAKARNVSRAKDRGPWVEWPERMWEKTAGRRLFAKIPLGEREAEIRESILDADDLAPGEAARALYGTEVPPPAGEENGTEQAAGEVVQEGPSTEAKPTAQVASETDGTPAPAPADSEKVEEGDFTIPPEVAGDADVQAANAAAEALVPFGKHKGITLAELVALGDEGMGRIKWALKQWKTEPFRAQLFAFAKVYARDEYDAAVAESKTEAEVA